MGSEVFDTIEMKTWSPQLWTVFRITLIAVNIIAIVSYPRNESNLNWMACLLVSSITSVSLFIWLTLIRTRSTTDWSEPFSWRKPFFPMISYPIRFWFLTSISFMAGGGFAVLKDLAFHNGQEAFGGTFFFWGLGILIALKIWIKIFRNSADAIADP